MNPTVSPFLRPLGILAAILGTIQSVTWMILSILMIALRMEVWVPESQNVFNIFALYLFFQSKRFPLTEDFKNIVVHESSFIAIVAIYSVISLLWLISSLFLAKIFYRKGYVNVKNNCFIWVILTMLTTCFDVIVVIIISFDLRTMQGAATLDPESKLAFTTVIGVAMTIFARGYVLLVVNFSIAFYLFRITTKIVGPIHNNQPYTGQTYQNTQNPNVLQGLVWTILTILVIMIRTRGWTPNLVGVNVYSWLVFNVIFFPEHLNLEEKFIMTADVFMGFSAFYLPLSFLWCIVSLTLIWALWYKLWAYTKWCLYAWCTLAGILTFFDFILIILFSIDYASIEEIFVPDFERMFQVQVVIGSVMTIAARGFVIFVLNGIFVVLFTIWSLEINAEDYGQPKLTMSPYSRWHTTGSIPRVPPTLQHDNFTKNNQNINQDVVQMRFHPSRQISLELNNQVNNSLNNHEFNRPPSVEPDYIRIPRLNEDREKDNRRFTKVLPTTPPKAVLRPNSRYY